MTGGRIFVTGGTGFFGKSLLDRMLRGFGAEWRLLVLSRDPGRFLAENPQFAGLGGRLEWMRGDVRDFAFPPKMPAVDAVIHAGTPALALPPGEMRDIILKGTERVLRFARECGAARLLFVSSGAVYGPQEPQCTHVGEEHPCRPVTEYGIAKLEAEGMCAASGIPSVIARGFAFTGRYLNRDIHFAIGNFIRDALAGREIVIQGDGTPRRSYLHADDLVEWLFAMLERGRAGAAYNLGSDAAVSIRELAETVRETLGSPAPVRVLREPVPGTPPQWYVPDITRARRELGLEVRIPLQEAIRRSLRPGERR
jgi:dTDP-glucose 4,6-dehydratase